MGAMAGGVGSAGESLRILKTVSVSVQVRSDDEIGGQQTRAKRADSDCT